MEARDLFDVDYDDAEFWDANTRILFDDVQRIGTAFQPALESLVTEERYWALQCASWPHTVVRVFSTSLTVDSFGDFLRVRFAFEVPNLTRWPRFDRTLRSVILWPASEYGEPFFVARRRRFQWLFGKKPEIRPLAAPESEL